ncbi:hypothetical protein QUC32_02815 [Novosphingobium resinovorum]|jgi:hypothetical protein|uniref:hypothetical protein n=1 Tax=Novosphingobium TaxID=165696 RepID=UPI001B3C8A2F|nr:MULTISPECIES: hypothetical protein [Novosphingobium]MBF7013768.1 hypothetical protein [Novosphingobium sp. HR1a]WJM25909.1 hypothetical protein QUC32_02815 [Novosphingobium resinovorum]
MADLNESYIIDLRRALVEAICSVSAQRQEAASGHKGDTLFIGSAEVSETLVLLLSEFVEGVPDLRTPADVRRMSDIIAKKIRLNIADIRRNRTETGGRPPSSIVIRGN